MLSTFTTITAHSDGLETLMYPGEIEIMRLFWAHGPMRIKDVHQAIRQHRRIAYTTISTRCYRLVEQGLLTRSANGNLGDPLVAKVGEHDLVAQRLKTMLDSLGHTYPNALTHYSAARQISL